MEDKLQRVEDATMYVTFVEMTLLVIVLTMTLITVLKHMKFKFPLVLLLLLILADMSAIISAWGLHAEGTSYHTTHTVFLSRIIGLTTFGFNFGVNCMHWLFSLKYWIIAREVPKLW